MASNLPVEATGNAIMSQADMELMRGAARYAPANKPGELITPYLNIVQGLSPCLIRGNPLYDENARIGDLFDTLTRKMRKEVLAIPCLFETHYTEWKPKRGGLVKQWFTDSSKYDASGTEFGLRITEEGNEISPQPTFYCLLVEENGGSMPCAVVMASTQMKKARLWNSLINMNAFGDFLPPIFSKAYKLTTVPEPGVAANGQPTNNAGWKITPDHMTLNLPNGRALFAKALAFRESLDRGEGRPAPPVREGVAETHDGQAKADDDKEEIPF